MQKHLWIEISGLELMYMFFVIGGAIILTFVTCWLISCLNSASPSTARYERPQTRYVRMHAQTWDNHGNQINEQ